MNKFKKNWFRHLLQWGTLITIVIFLTKIFGNETTDPEAYCPFGGLETLSTYLVAGSMACSMTTTQIMMGVALAIAVIFFSKLFCGYLCPLGWGSEYLGKFRSALKIKEIVIRKGSLLDKVLRIFKYVLLFLIFYFTISNSELFCKNFDPYYAAATGFQGEITMWMTIIALIVFILGNFFIQMFWCKYFCPLGAISNIFKFTITFIVLIGIFAMTNLSGLAVSWVYLLGATTIIGYLSEIIYNDSKVFPILKIHRNTEACNNCGLCAKKCPYGIKVNTVKIVQHVDCTLCGECISNCTKKALTFGRLKGLRWLPACLVVVLFISALLVGSTWELPTIDEKWGDETKFEKLEKTTIEGLHSVKCFGSSKAFSAKLQKIPGVYGVSTFVKSNKAIIYYNPEETNPDKINEAIYVPVKFKIATPPVGAKIKVITIHTDKMFDKLDPNYLGMQIRNSKKAYYGLETEYGCPLIVRLYMDVNEPLDEGFLKSMVEMDELEMPVHGGGVKIIKVDYKFVDMAKEPEDTISRIEFLKRQFNYFKVDFKNNIEKLNGKNVAVYQIIYPDLDKPIITRNLPYLSNHLSQIKGFLGVETTVTDSEEYVIRISYSKDMLDDNKIWAALNKTKWSIKDKNGVISEVDPKISFENKGTTLVQ